MKLFSEVSSIAVKIWEYELKKTPLVNLLLIFIFIANLVMANFSAAVSLRGDDIGCQYKQG